MVDRTSRVPSWAWKGVLLPAGMLALLFSFVYRDPGFRETLRYTIQGVALTPIFVVAMRYPTWGPFPLLNTKALSFLGVLSYSLYLVHHVVLMLFERAPFGGVVRAALALLVSVALAWTLYRLVELPSARLRKRLSARLRGRPAGADASVPALADHEL